MERCTKRSELSDRENRKALDALRERGLKTTIHEEPGLIVIGAQTQGLSERLGGREGASRRS
jgi:hypothetical protein